MAGDRDPTIRFRGKRRARCLTDVLDELTAIEEFGAMATTKDPRGFCKYCESLIPRSQSGNGIAKHKGPCGLLCLGGGVPVTNDFHSDRCPVCFPLDTFPEGTKVP